MSNREEIGQAVRRCRDARQMTQEQLGKIIDLSRTWVCQVELGHFATTRQQLVKIEGALDLRTGTLTNLMATDGDYEGDTIWDSLAHRSPELHRQLRACAVNELILTGLKR